MVSPSSIRCIGINLIARACWRRDICSYTCKKSPTGDSFGKGLPMLKSVFQTTQQKMEWSRCSTRCFLPKMDKQQLVVSIDGASLLILKSTCAGGCHRRSSYSHTLKKTRWGCLSVGISMLKSISSNRRKKQSKKREIYKELCKKNESIPRGLPGSLLLQVNGESILKRHKPLVGSNEK